MKNSMLKGIGFGLTSGIITTLGLLIGLYSSTHSVGVVIGGVLIIALADSHIAKRNKEKPSHVIFEHVIITITVIVSTYFIGRWIGSSALFI